jgi:hypothetical protein
MFECGTRLYEEAELSSCVTGIACVDTCDPGKRTLMLKRRMGVVLPGVVGLVPGLIAYEKDAWRLCVWGKKGSDKK